MVSDIAAFTAPALAVSFFPIDARSLSMGGTGVAGAKASSAGLFNPALLAAQQQDADFSRVLPSVGAILDDQDDVLDTVDEIQNGSLEQTEQGIDNANADPSLGNVLSLGAAASALASDLPRLGSRPVNLEVGAGFGLGVPSRKIGVGLHANASLSAGVATRVNNADIVLLNQLSAYASDGSFAGDCGDTAIFDASCQVRPLDEMMQSALTVVGVVIGEVGLSLAHEFQFGEQTLALGITPKIVQVDTINYTQVINSDEELGDVVDDDRYRREYSDFNIDIGVAKVFGEEGRTLTAGLVVKNLIAQSYRTAADQFGRSYEISLEPQARAGLAKHWGAFNVAADLDLTRKTRASALARTASSSAWAWSWTCAISSCVPATATTLSPRASRIWRQLAWVWGHWTSQRCTPMSKAWA